MNCERTTEVRYNTATYTNGHRCARLARWSVQVPTGETLRLCTQHKNQLVKQWPGQNVYAERLCPGCGGEDLFSGFFGRDGLAVPVDMGDVEPPGVRWTTFCNECGSEVK